MVTVVDTVAEKKRLRHPEKAHRPDTEIARKPDWIRVKAPTSKGYLETRNIVKSNNLVTVCEEAGCPNIGSCWQQKHASFMIMGEICTRACAFCNVATGRPNALDPNEPENVARAVRQMGLKHVVVTSVDRDDLADGGAQHFVDTITAIREASPQTDRRDPDARFSCARTGRWRRSSAPARTSSTTISKPCRRTT